MTLFTKSVWIWGLPGRVVRKRVYLGGMAPLDGRPVTTPESGVMRPSRSLPDPDGRWLAREVAWSLFVTELCEREHVVDFSTEDDEEISVAEQSIYEFADELVGRLEGVGLRLTWVDEGALILARESTL